MSKTLRAPDGTPITHVVETVENLRQATFFETPHGVLDYHPGDIEGTEFIKDFADSEVRDANGKFWHLQECDWEEDA